MELKFESPLSPSFIEKSSNRTFMELKFAYRYAPQLVVCVLIVPLWN